jgi:predicted RNA binding protein YcfA (HicA-like mRNA interferase family)
MAGASFARRAATDSLQHPTKRGTVTVAGKPKKTLHPKVLASILKQAALEEE